MLSQHGAARETTLGIQSLAPVRRSVMSLVTEFCLSIEFCSDAKAMGSCSHCGKQREALKRCSRCKQDSYCGAECQNAAWKGHRKSCVSLDDPETPTPNPNP